jgi:hypothetical protein
MEQDMFNFHKYKGNPIVTPSDYNWNMGHHNIMFPCVVDMSRYLESPIDRFYLYLAAHNGKSIGLATAPQPLGPWTMYADNPVFRLEDASPPFRGHISSPELVAVNRDYRFYLYFHGPCDYPERRGQMTGLAFSNDGVHFTPSPGNPILTTGPKGAWDSAMTAYLRVLPYREGFIGLYMGHDGAPPKRPRVAQSAEGVATSVDGVRWEKWTGNPLLTIGDGDFGGIRHVALLRQADGLYIVYSPRTDEDLGTEVLRLARARLGETPDNWGKPEKLGAILEPTEAWEKQELRDPFLLRHENELYLYYAGGDETGLGVAVAKLES